MCIECAHGAAADAAGGRPTMGEPCVTMRRVRGHVYDLVDVGDGLLAPLDRGCDWQQYDPRFRHCLTCPLPKYRLDMTSRQSALVRQRLAAGEPVEVLALR